MKIEIEYNGAFAVCSIEPMDEPGRMVNFNEADTKSQTYALSAFRTIEEHWRREKQLERYLTHHVGSDKAGIIRTGLRSISNVDRTKVEKQWNGTI